MAANEPTLGEQALRRHGLSAEPFANECFFPTDDLQTRLSMAAQTLHASGRILILSGPTGIGRSSFLTELARREDGVRHVPVAGHAALTLTAIQEYMGLLPSSDPDAVADALDAGEHRAALLLDDADQLMQPEIQRLFELHRAVSRRRVKWPMVIACNEENAATLETLARQAGLGETDLQHMRLPRLDADQSRRYLLWRLQAAGSPEGAVPISDRDMRRIHERAEGIPAILNREAAHVLCGSRNGSLAAGLAGRPWHSAALLLGTLLVAGVLVSWFVPDGQDDTLPDGQEVTELDITGPDPDSADQATGTATSEGRPSDGGGKAEIDAGAVVSAGKDGPPATDSDTAAASGAIEAGDSGGAATPGESGAAAGAGSDASAGGETAGANTGSAAGTSEATDPGRSESAGTDELDAGSGAGGEQAAATGSLGNAPADDDAGIDDTGGESEAVGENASAAANAGADPQDAGRSAQTATGEGAGPDWLEQRASGHYTIQVLAARERATINRFLGQVEGDESLHVLETTRGDERWLVVVTGDYPDADRARNAITRLPESWRRFEPFPRAFASLAPQRN